MKAIQIEFGEGDRIVWVIDDDQVMYIVAGITGSVGRERRERIAVLIKNLVAECQGADVVFAPFVFDGKPS